MSFIFNVYNVPLLTSKQRTEIYSMYIVMLATVIVCLKIKETSDIFLWENIITCFVNDQSKAPINYVT